MTERPTRKNEDARPETVSNSETGTADPTLPRPIDQVRRRIAGDFYRQSHVQEKIVRALLEMLDGMD
jgi:hypothetical protein